MANALVECSDYVSNIKKQTLCKNNMPTSRKATFAEPTFCSQRDAGKTPILMNTVDHSSCNLVSRLLCTTFECSIFISTHHHHHLQISPSPACTIRSAGGRFMLTGPKVDHVLTSSILLGLLALPGVSGTSTLLDLVGVLCPSSSSSSVGPSSYASANRAK